MMCAIIGRISRTVTPSARRGGWPVLRLMLPNVRRAAAAGGSAVLTVTIALWQAGCAAAPAVAALPPAAGSCRAASGPASVELAWIGPTPENQRLALDAWCAGVGPPLTIVSAAADVSGSRVAVISWNTNAGAGDLFKLITEIRTGKVEGAPIDHLIVLVQEAHRAGPEVPLRVPSGLPLARVLPRPPIAHDIGAVAAAARMNLVYVPSMRNGPGQNDRGNAILTTARLSDLRLQKAVRRSSSAVI
jgi:hypothetical protein